MLSMHLVDLTIFRCLLFWQKSVKSLSQSLNFEVSYLVHYSGKCQTLQDLTLLTKMCLCWLFANIHKLDDCNAFLFIITHELAVHRMGLNLTDW